jgi:hypothetical protein
MCDCGNSGPRDMRNWTIKESVYRHACQVNGTSNPQHYKCQGRKKDEKYPGIHFTRFFQEFSQGTESDGVLGS